MSRCARALKYSKPRGGFLTERRFLEAMTYPYDKRKPCWVRSVREATYQEDVYEETDAVIETDIGELSIQIKSSKKGGNKFKRKQHPRRKKFIGVLVILQNYTPEKIRKEAYRVLVSIYQTMLMERSSVSVI